eukprot:11854693-Ditylum_brightwellii.AAC.1
MSTSKTNINYKNNYFEYPDLTLIHGEPTTATLFNLYSKVRSNVQSVNTTLEGGANSHLPLVCNATTYACIPGVAAFVCPLNIGQLAVPATATQAQVAQLQDQHEEALYLFQEEYSHKQDHTADSKHLQLSV